VSQTDQNSSNTLEEVPSDISPQESKLICNLLQKYSNYITGQLQLLSKQVTHAITNSMEHALHESQMMCQIDKQERALSEYCTKLAKLREELDNGEQLYKVCKESYNELSASYEELKNNWTQVQEVVAQEKQRITELAAAKTSLTLFQEFLKKII